MPGWGFARGSVCPVQPGCTAGFGCISLWPDTIRAGLRWAVVPGERGEQVGSAGLGGGGCWVGCAAWAGAGGPHSSVGCCQSLSALSAPSRFQGSTLYQSTGGHRVQLLCGYRSEHWDILGYPKRWGSVSVALWGLGSPHCGWDDGDLWWYRSHQLWRGDSRNPRGCMVRSCQEQCPGI